MRVLNPKPLQLVRARAYPGCPTKSGYTAPMFIIIMRFEEATVKKIFTYSHPGPFMGQVGNGHDGDYTEVKATWEERCKGEDIWHEDVQT